MKSPTRSESYQLSEKLKKCNLFLKYQLRQFNWWFQDIAEGSKDAFASEINDIEIMGSLKKSWEENGFVKLKSGVSSENIDLVNEEISRIRKYLESKGQGKRDKFGNNIGRICNIHSLSRIVYKFLCDQRIRNFLRFALNGEPVLWASMTFNQGTEQYVHVDTGGFFTEPAESMAAVWTALEDIHMDSGPVYYYEKSHLDYLKVDDVLDMHPNLKQKVHEFRSKNTNARAQVNADLVREVVEIYHVELVSHWENSGRKKIPVLINKGDSFVWSQWLAHGGLTRTNPKKTRNSIVHHYCSKDSKHWHASDFLLNSDRLCNVPPTRINIKYSRDGLYARQITTFISDYD